MPRRPGNVEIKWQYKKVGVFAYTCFTFPCDDVPSLENVRPRIPHWQYTKLFIFRFVCQFILLRQFTTLTYTYIYWNYQPVPVFDTDQY